MEGHLEGQVAQEKDREDVDEPEEDVRQILPREDYGCVMSFAVGGVLSERILIGGGDLVTKRLALLKELVGRAPGRYPSLASVAARIDRWRWDDVFELGIRSLLTGIDANCTRLARHSRRRPRARRARS